MSNFLVLGAVVLGLFPVMTMIELLVEKFGWVEEEKDQFDKEF